MPPADEVSTASTARIIASSRAAADARYSLQIAVSKEYFFLTIPGIIRLLEMLLAGLNLSAFGYYCTFYDKILDDAVSPLFLANTREVFFVVANCSTFLTCFYLILASVICFRSHAALMESLFMFIFDFSQFLLVIASSIGLILLYMDVHTKTVYGSTQQARQGLAVTGMLLACLHLIGCIYDLGIYVRHTNTVVRSIDSTLVNAPSSSMKQESNTGTSS